MEKQNRGIHSSKQARMPRVNPVITQDLEDQYILAKNMLMDLAEDETPIACNHVPVSKWNQQQPKAFTLFLTRSTTPSLALKPTRKTVYARAFGDNRTNRHQNMQESIIPQLKVLLQQLQSPQKKQYFQQRHQSKQKQVNFLEEKMKRKHKAVHVQDLIRRKRDDFRVKNISSHKDHRFSQANGGIESSRYYVSRERTSENRLAFNQHARSYRQARKNRTLKNLLL